MPLNLSGGIVCWIHQEGPAGTQQPITGPLSAKGPATRAPGATPLASGPSVQS